jgi:ketosteroid isomerase-like protein
LLWTLSINSANNSDRFSSQSSLDVESEKEGEINMRSWQRIVAALVAIGASAGAVFAQTSGKAEEALLAADAAWEKAYSAKDVEKSVAFFDEQGSMLPSNAPVLNGKDAITKSLASAFKAPDYTLTWHANKVGVASSGELGYTSGTYEFISKEASGKTVSDKGKYLTVWKKQPDGSWKVLLDIYNSDLPPA